MAENGSRHVRAGESGHPQPGDKPVDAETGSEGTPFEHPDPRGLHGPSLEAVSHQIDNAVRRVMGKPEWASPEQIEHTLREAIDQYQELFPHRKLTFSNYFWATFVYGWGIWKKEDTFVVIRTGELHYYKAGNRTRWR